MSGKESLNLLLDLYQKCKEKGEWATLFMETKKGKDIITFKIGSIPTGSTAGNWTPDQPSRKSQKNSQQKRDQKRKEEFLAKKSLEPKELLSKNKPVLFVEPKGEIDLENPKENEVTETVVKYVGEYVYDTKLQNDDIHQKVWETSWG